MSTRKTNPNRTTPRRMSKRRVRKTDVIPPTTMQKMTSILKSHIIKVASGLTLIGTASGAGISLTRTEQTAQADAAAHATTKAELDQLRREMEDGKRHDDDQDKVLRRIDNRTVRIETMMEIMTPAPKRPPRSE